MWRPISLESLSTMIRNELEDCAPELQAIFANTAIPPEKWTRSPWRDQGGGFWAIAVKAERVLWYNDIEAGFNVSPFSRWGEIGEYGCNQDELRQALPRLVGDLGVRVNAPESISRLSYGSADES